MVINNLISILLLNFSVSCLLVAAEVALLAHAQGVSQAVGVLALPGLLDSSALSVARLTHILGIVLASRVGASRNLHGQPLSWFNAAQLSAILWYLRAGGVS